MLKSSLQKGIAIGVIFIFIGMMIIPSNARIVERSLTVSSDSDTLYVGGSGSGNYSKIQDAIDNASYGDTVFVYNGTYYGNEIHQDYDSIVLVNKSLNLIGEDRTTTIIDGGENHDFFHYIVLFQGADWSNLSGFTIRNGGHGRGVIVLSSHINISNNIIIPSCDKSSLHIRGSDNIVYGNNFSYEDIHHEGIIWFASNNSNFSNNILSNAFFYSIHSGFNPNTNYIFGNRFSDCWMGIWSDSGMDNSVICGNVFINISSFSIWIGNLRGCKIINNKFLNNEGTCINLLAGDNNIIANNLFQNNAECIYLSWGSNFNHIYHNNFINNSRNADFGLFSLYNKWEGNYWNRPRMLPKTIIGSIGLVVPSWVNFDWNPAQEPYDIGG